MATDVPLDARVDHHQVDVAGVHLHYVEAGASSAPAVVLLHGFPEDWYSWRHQIGPFVDAGYRVLAPDMRGVGGSDRPSAVRAYTLDTLADDAAAVIRAAGADRAIVVGHDWGAAIAWRLAQRQPALVRRLAVLNGPHPGLFARALGDLRQVARSLYMLSFQIPWLPERLLRARDCAGLRRALLRGSRPGAFTAHDMDRYVRMWERPGALTGGLAAYRALPRQLRSARAAAATPVAAPVLVIWGDRDPYLGAALADPGALATGPLRVEHVADAGHFVQADAPERVNALLLAFMREDGERYDVD